MNGKSTLCSFIMKPHKHYATKGGSGFFSQDVHETNKPCSPLAALVSKRIIIINEPSSKIFNGAIFKKYLTTDGHTFRNMYEKGEKLVDLHFNFFIQCNSMPTFSDSQQFAVWRRVFIFEFSKQFSLTPEEGKELCDPYIYDKFLLPEWQSHLVKEIIDAVEVPEPNLFMI